MITEIGLVITGRPLRKSVKTNGERLGATPNPIVEVRLITATDLGDHPGPIRVIIPTEMRTVAACALDVARRAGLVMCEV